MSSPGQPPSIALATPLCRGTEADGGEFGKPTLVVGDQVCSREQPHERHAQRSAPRRFPAAHRAKGFTLIEMIAAFVIFALAIASLMQILTMSLNNTRRSLDETRAALWAQSLLDNVGIGERIEAGSASGEFDRNFRWQMDIEQIDPQLVEATGSGAMGDAATSAQVGNEGTSPIVEMTQMELYHVQLRVLWGGNRERSAMFSTLRLAMPDMTQGGSLGGGSDSASARGGSRETSQRSQRLPTGGKR